MEHFETSFTSFVSSPTVSKRQIGGSYRIEGEIVVKGMVIFWLRLQHISISNQWKILQTKILMNKGGAYLPLLQGVKTFSAICGERRC